MWFVIVIFFAFLAGCGGKTIENYYGPEGGIAPDPTGAGRGSAGENAGGSAGEPSEDGGAGQAGLGGSAGEGAGGAAGKTADAGTDAVADSSSDVSDAGSIAKPLLTLSIDPATPLPSTLVMGADEVEVLRIRITTGAEDVYLTKLPLPSKIGFLGGVNNLRLRNADTGIQVGGTQASIPPTGTVVFEQITNAKIPAHSKLVLKLLVDVTSFTQGGVSGDAFRFGIKDTTGIEAVTASDMHSLTDEEIQVVAYGAGVVAWAWGSTFTIYCTKITIAKASDSPSGPSSSSSEQVVAKFAVTNSANVGNYTATLRLMDLDIGSSISLSKARAIKVYKDTVSAGNLVATTNADPKGGSFNDTSFLDAGFTDTDISAGALRMFIVTMDTSDAVTGNSLTVGLNFGDVLWSDGLTEGIQRVDSLPLPGNTLVY